MDESLIHRIERLERSNRRWKVFALLLSAAMMGFSLAATFFFVRYTHVLRELEAAQVQADMAAEEAEAARRAAEAQLRAHKKE